jgi:hypothetical protein
MRRALTGHVTSLGGRASRLAGLPAALILFGAGDVAQAQAPLTGAACIAANEQAGPLRRAGKLREARKQLRDCSAPSCPTAVQKDCIAGAAQVDADVPTIAFSVQDGAGNDLSAVQVSLDGEVIGTKLDGKAIEVDPGEHLFRFESAGQPTIEKRIVTVEGEKNRRERVVLGELKAPPATGPAKLTVVLAPPDKPNVQKRAGYLVGGGGLFVTGVGAVFGLVAVINWKNTKTECGPGFPTVCTGNETQFNSDVTHTDTAAGAADVFLGIGGAAVVAGVVLLLTAPPPVPTATVQGRLKVTPTALPNGGGLMLGGSF